MARPKGAVWNVLLEKDAFLISNLNIKKLAGSTEGVKQLPGVGRCLCEPVNQMTGSQRQLLGAGSKCSVDSG